LYHILYFPTRYFPAISGAEFYMQSIAELMNSKYNYIVDVYTSTAIDFKGLRHDSGKFMKPGDKYYDRINSLKISRYPIDYNLEMIEKLHKIKNLSFYEILQLSDECLKEFLKNGPYLDSLIEKMKGVTNFSFDLIHTTFFPYFNLLLALMIGKITNKPTVCTPFFHFSNPRYHNKHLVEALKKFDKIIACTALEKKVLTEKLGISERKIKIISMGVDFTKFQSSEQTHNEYSFKSKFFRPNEKNYKMVLFCGYKNFEKGALSILKAIPNILKKCPKVYFVFIGPSTIAFNRELSKLQKKIKPRIINLTPDNLKGYYDSKKIAAFKETDIFLMPSRSDAYGIAYLEAWASGKPVIGANIGATPEVIRNNFDGLLVEFNNFKDIANKVVTLLKNEDFSNKMGQEGKRKVKKSFSWYDVAKQTNQVYMELIHK
jgi:glycosyltransferase involved in cell wall biosynthesis